MARKRTEKGKSKAIEGDKKEKVVNNKDEIQLKTNTKTPRYLITWKYVGDLMLLLSISIPIVSCIELYINGDVIHNFHGSGASKSMIHYIYG